MPRRFLIAFIIALVLVGSHGPYLPFNRYEITSVFAFLCAGWLLFCLISPGTRKPARGFTSYSVVLALFFAESAGGIFFTIRLDQSLEFVLKYLGGICIILAVRRTVRGKDDAHNLLSLLTGLAGGVGLLGVAQQFIPFLRPSGFEHARVFAALFSNVNYYSCYLLVHLPLCAYLYAAETRPARKPLWAGVWALLIVGLCFSGSPGGQGVALIVLAMLAGFLHRSGRSADLKRMALGTGGALGLYLVLVGLLALTQEAESSRPVLHILARREWHADHLWNRLEYWKGAWMIFHDHWLTGTGPFTFSEMYFKYDLSQVPLHAHSLYMETLADSGIVGFSLLTAFIATYYAAVLRRLKTESEMRADGLFAVSLAVTGFLLHNLIEYNWPTTVFLFLLTILVALTEVFLSVDGAAPPAGNKLTATVFAAGIAALTLWASAHYFSYSWIVHRQVLEAQDKEEIIRLTDRASGLCPACDEPHMIRGIVLMEDYTRTRTFASLEDARWEFSQAVRLSPQYSEAQFYLGHTALLLGETGRARMFLNLAAGDRRYRANALQDLRKLDAEPTRRGRRGEGT